ncbi:uncharacterized protein KY384_009067 [Bacidia gigantensis]|uniref:uncharacterized protein n=1 Tax=Bacidia gigantensis TaxID=2732470 RepID=UPI001D055C7E|nr:uncharacterized protein KY384_009067 [Bacidia gigantensis]KAG8525423.1 hypothetical protein KY384_009067 [Bacidia gigantensis]
MSLRLLVRDQPVRTLAIITSTHALIFQHGMSPSVHAQSNPYPPAKTVSKCMVEFSNNADLSEYRVLRPSGIHGTLGLINIGQDLFLCVITEAAQVAKVRPYETVHKIHSVEFYCLTNSNYDLDYRQDFNPYTAETFPSHGHHRGTYGDDPSFEHPCHELSRMLSSGTFYYSVDFDLTNRLQSRISEESAFDVESLDEGFLWNAYMIEPLIKFRARLSKGERVLLDKSRILTSAIRGFVSTVTVPASATRGTRPNLPATLTLISRLSCRRAGTRFNSRGIDDEGNAANFVETETILWHPTGLCFSYAQVRGSVPLFWEQAPGLLPGQHKIQVTRSPEATQPAFDKHFESLETDYGVISILNLLSESKPGEAELTARYKYHIQHSPLNDVVHVGTPSENRLLDVQFDFHAETRGGGYESAGAVKYLVQHAAESFGFFLCEDVQSNEKSSRSSNSMIMFQQDGVFRTNCLDCLDRTNLIQTILSQMALELFFKHRRESISPDYWGRHSIVWADNGDALSKIYAGTGALKSSFTRHGKMSIAGAIADARKSATRLYVNNFVDKGKQNTIDMLLGRLVDQSPVYLYDPITDYVNSELNRRVHEFSNSENIQIWVGTLNVNGKTTGLQQDLSSWLCPQPNWSRQRPDIVVVGLQEIVELSPQQIMSTDPVRLQGWEQAVKQTINKDLLEGYVLLRTGQLVGAALMVFVKTSALSRIKNVEGSTKKTGLSGMAGNKGAVAIRMDFASTRLCFVTAHLAAGFANFEERNHDYRTISHGLHFLRNRSIEDHDTIIWAGDFNYRIGLGDEKVRHLVKLGDLDSLYKNDQLNLQMVAGRTFPHYSESRITFLPTYKFDIASDNYDSSEKARIPAWCDRVLRKGENLKQINYIAAPLRFSDHRPVYATFECTVDVVHEVRKEQLSHEIYTKRKAEIGDATAGLKGDGFAEDMMGYEPIAPELPPASSDRQKWWLDNSLPARSQLKAPGEMYELNKDRPANPFIEATESDWVLVSKGRPNTNRPATTAPPVFRKPAPPIPQKPESLSSNGEPELVSNKKSHDDDILRSIKLPTEGEIEAPIDRSNVIDKDIQTFTPETSSVAIGKKRLGSPKSIGSNGPPLPPRSLPADRELTAGLLDEDDGGGVKGIPSLQPQRRT